MRIWVIALFFALGIGAVFGPYLLHRGLIVEAVEINMSVKVGDTFGLNADADALRFGKVMPGTQAERELLVSNNHQFPVRVSIQTSGDMGNWVRVSENDFLLEPYGGKNVTFVVHPAISEFGEYEGKAVVVMRRSILT